jgi:hypothetical protein
MNTDPDAVFFLIADQVRWFRIQVYAVNKIVREFFLSNFFFSYSYNYSEDLL